MNRREAVVGIGAVVATTACADRTRAPVASASDPRAKEIVTPRPGLIPGTFVGGRSGPWTVERVVAVRGEALPRVERIDILPGGLEDGHSETWRLRGVAGHARYTTRAEKSALDTASPQLGRREATRAALIPIRKSPAWWAMTQDERRAVFEERSGHVAESMKYLPRIARRLYHCRDLGEPFDFLTWFEFAPEHEAAFDDLVGMLRSREEWAFVDREVDIRLVRT